MRKQFLVILVMFSVLVGTPALLAQSGLGTVTGRVTDPSGSVIPGAKVSAFNKETGLTAVSVTNGSGLFEVSDLVPGTYSVEASAPSFKSLIRSNVLIQAEDRIGLDFRLEVGSTSETITISSTQSQLGTENAQLGEVVTNSMIETLPTLSTSQGRDPLGLLVLAGNVQGSGARAGLNVSDTNGGNLFSGQGDTRINGGRTGSVEYLVDGVPATGGFVHNVVNTTPAIDSVEEFKVITNGFSAEYGRLSGGLVSLSTKGGGNDFHGQLFEYNQNAYLNANTWSNDGLCKSGTPSACAKANFRLNDFGAAGGGPVVIPHVYNGRNKTFWFANFEGTRQSTSGNTSLGQTITDLERTGDLSDIGSPAGQASGEFPYAKVYDPYGQYSATPVTEGPNDPTPGASFYQRLTLAGGDGRHIPANELDPVIQKYIALMPHPNRPAYVDATSGVPSGTAGNYTVAQPSAQDSNVFGLRVDQVITDKQRIFGRFSHIHLTDRTAAFYPNYASSGTDLNGGFSIEAHYDYAISPTTLLTLSTGGNFNPFHQGTLLPSSVQSASFGYGSALQSFLKTSDLVRVQTGPTTEGTNINGGNQYSQGLNGNTGTVFNSTNFVYSGALTKVLNRHSLKFGYEGRRYYDNYTTLAQSNAGGDGYNFDPTPVTEYVGDGNVWNAQGYANGIASFLYGIDGWITINGAVGRSLASNYYASYAQDDFKATPNLTLNVGLRWEMESPVTERHNVLTVWDPDAPPPFQVSPGFTWAGALSSAGYDPSEVATPDWVTNGFPRGGIAAVRSPQHPSRYASQYHPWNFAPRLGFAYQVDNKTVVRGSFAVVYLPTSGNLTDYTDAPGVFYANGASNLSTHPGSGPGPNTGEYPTFIPRTVANPFDSTQFYGFTRDYVTLNSQAAANSAGAGGVSIYKHMPRELDWSLGIQRQLPNQWLLELTYSANWSDTLLSLENPSHFPKNFYSGGSTGQNFQLYENSNKLVPSPTAGQIAGGNQTGPQQYLGVLEYGYPYFGPVFVEGNNAGTSNYNSLNVRVQRRFANGFQLLFNYTFGKALDDVGGSDATLSNGGSNGTGGKAFQSVDASPKSTYNISSFDETHRVSAFYNYQLPFGRGRRFLYDTSNLGLKALDYAVGGWELSGTTIYRSGRPISYNDSQANNDGSIFITTAFPVFAPGYSVDQIKTHTAHNDQILPGGILKPNSSPALNPAAVLPHPNFVYGNVPIEISQIRNPGNWDSNLSIMKSFAVNADSSRYFQLRLESYNIFNHPGLGPYDTNLTDIPTGLFGNINGNNNSSRTIQVGGRFVF